jgi:hypothetical protein
MYQSLYENIQASCCHISVSVSGELVSEGTGFAFLPEGEVLTAAHVVTGRTPIKEEDYLDPNQRIFCKFPGHPEAEYKVNICGMNVLVPSFREAIQVDLAILSPIKKPAKMMRFLVANTNPPGLGQTVFVAGYSDELTAPFGVDRLTTGGQSGLSQVTRSSHGGYMTDLGGPIIKRGVIGNIVRAVCGYENNSKELHIELFYIDNSVHSGASGGPVCNESGEAIGIISQRSVTSASQEDAPKLKVPSGCTIGIGLNPLKALAGA